LTREKGSRIKKSLLRKIPLEVHLVVLRRGK